ncbi:uncharacterized protein EDB93DRAFT_1253907 [Suillus bovinus]|uniref:uncharacterized protein n=1 Tax=Suillus bovinus TaxID=48563 RepID=UPI001B86F98F|nr:uncharacterized protein EDB93DRAFT_1253907 [Suillus bovinus]KAG2136614.1 hypothetical protein EDB93DRAFT_1253907 [Suillus bovinus]
MIISALRDFKFCSICSLAASSFSSLRIASFNYICPNASLMSPKWTEGFWRVVAGKLKVRVGDDSAIDPFSFKDVSVTDGGLNTVAFLEGGDGVVRMLKKLTSLMNSVGSGAFPPVINDIWGNITKVRARYDA